jgi:hypothetical protein
MAQLFPQLLPHDVIDALRKECDSLVARGSIEHRASCIYEPESFFSPSCLVSRRYSKNWSRYKACRLEFSEKPQATWRVLKFLSSPGLNNFLWNSCACHHPYFFNEQYIVKEPGHSSSSSFPVHADKDYLPRSLRRSPFFSLWIPLEETITRENGTVALVSNNNNNKDESNDNHTDVNCHAGDILYIPSGERHFSYPNCSNTRRRVYMMQVSLQPMVQAPAQQSIALAIPFPMST